LLPPPKINTINTIRSPQASDLEEALSATQGELRSANATAAQLLDDLEASHDALDRTSNELKAEQEAGEKSRREIGTLRSAVAKAKEEAARQLAELTAAAERVRAAPPPLPPLRAAG
jgi:septal ring factor EnvC (AmiA/AmiB activator)